MAIIYKCGIVVKLVLITYLSLILFSENAAAVSVKNTALGVFTFRLDLRAENEVDYTTLDLIFLDFAELNEVTIFDGLTITNAGQTFAAMQADTNFGEAAAFLTNGESDWIEVLIAQSPRAISIKSIEPYLLFGDFTGNSGIDFTGLDMESIELLITYADFAYGMDPVNGSFTDIAIEGEVTLMTGPVPITWFAEAYGSSAAVINYSILSDVDGDGDVDGFDLFQRIGRIPITLIADAYGSFEGDVNYNLISDADGDGDVDGLDLFLISQSYLP